MPGFDIFKIGTDGKPSWLETAESMDLAMAQVNALRAANLPCHYIILSQATGKRIVVTAKGEIRRE